MPKTYRNILCPVDFSPPSRAALRTATELAVRFQSTLTLVHVYQIPILGHAEAGPGSPFVTSVAELAGQELAEWKREAEQLARRSVNAVSLEGVSWDQIVKYTRERKFDLVVVGTHGRTGLKHVFIGSVAERVVRHAACPVLVVRDSQPARFASRIVCPLDFSETSHEAMLAAVHLAIAFDSTLTLVNVYHLPVLAVPEMSLNPILLGEIMKSADEGLAKWTREATQLGARRVEPTKLEGIPWDVIVKLVHDGGADLIVMGTHGRTGLRHALLGSVAERVVRHALCPVLVVRPPASTPASQ